MSRQHWIPIALLAGLLGLCGLWQWAASADVITPALLKTAVLRLSSLGDQAWMPVIVLALYVVGSLVVFPLVALVALTGLLFGALWGFVYALTGTMLAAITAYLLGRGLGAGTVEHYGGVRFERLARMLTQRGVTTMILVSLLPIAPFTLTSMAAGALRLRVRDYLAGTLIGITPGLFAVTVIGSQLTTLLRDVDWLTFAAAAGAIILALSGLWLLNRFARRRKGRIQ